MNKFFNLNFFLFIEHTQPPYMMKKEVMAGVAQLEQFDEELYKVGGDEEGKYLIATSGMSVRYSIIITNNDDMSLEVWRSPDDTNDNEKLIFIYAGVVKYLIATSCSQSPPNPLSLQICMYKYLYVYIRLLVTPGHSIIHGPFFDVCNNKTPEANSPEKNWNKNEKLTWTRA